MLPAFWTLQRFRVKICAKQSRRQRPVMKILALALILAAAPALAATPTNTTVASYHGAPDRAGNFIVPGLDRQSAQMIHRAQGFDGRIDGHVYAQPLYWRADGATHGYVIAVTGNNSVYALQ